MPSFLRGDGTRLANKRVKIGGQAIAKLFCLIFENHAPRTNGAAGLDLPVSKRTQQSSTVCTSPSTDLLMERGGGKSGSSTMHPRKTAIL